MYQLILCKIYPQVKELDGSTENKSRKFRMKRRESGGEIEIMEAFFSLHKYTLDGTTNTAK